MITDSFRRYKLDHLTFWLFYVLFWLVVSGSLSQPWQILNTFIVVFFHALVSYFNIYALVPLFLQRQKFVSYIVSLLLSITLTCFPLAVIIYALSALNGQTPQNIWTQDFFISNSFTTGYAVAITMILRLTMQWYRREKEKSELLRLNTETELKYLKSQINPHFLFNCLNSIYALTLKKSDDAPQTVLKLSEMLRYLLYEAGEQKVIVEKEINYLKNYLELEKIRLGNRGTIKFEAVTDDDDYLIEPMLLMPFVENSFKHGLNLQAADGWVEIVLNINDGKLQFSISNNKSKKTSVNSSVAIGGIGIENVKKRLGLLYPAAHELTITDTADVYRVELGLHLN